MTIMVALSQVIPLSDFNVALGYNLSHPKQVLPRHPRTHLLGHTHARTHTMFFFSFSRCSAVCICVTDTAYVCVFTSHLSKNVFQLCNGRCNMRTYELPLAQKRTPFSTQHQRHIDKLSNSMFLYLQRLP